MRPRKRLVAGTVGGPLMFVAVAAGVLLSLPAAAAQGLMLGARRRAGGGRVTAKAIIGAYYGRAPAYSYFDGLSDLDS